MVKIKICGITNLEDALAAVEFGADMLGFNFYEKSPRYIAPEAAREVIGNIGEAADSVGVFVNASLEDITRTAEETGITLIQLHGDETAALARAVERDLGVDVIKAFRISRDLDEKSIAEFECAHILVDAFAAGLYGGTGIIADRDAAKRIASENGRMFLAGGLTPENVAEAVRYVRPYAVDVASGVESAPGKKDIDKMKAFIRNARKS